MEQSYRSTITIYKSILEQFNPALEKLIYLGNKYLQAFYALSEAADVYFTALQKIGEQALQSSTSQILGEILIQMSESQIHLNRNLEIVAETFHVDLLQHMEKNTKLDVQFINDSWQQYEKEYRHRVASIDKSMMDLRRMESRRDKNVWELKENMVHLRSELQVFVSESQQAAELEEKRRYRFLAEKHQLLSNTLLQFYTKARTLILNKAPLWKEELEASHNPVQNVLNSPPSQRQPTGHLTPTHLENLPRLPTDFGPIMARQSFSQEPLQMTPSAQPETKRKTTPRTPSLGSASGLSRSTSFGEQAAWRAEADNKEGNSSHPLKMQAIVPYVTGSNQTLLPLSVGDVVTLLLPEAQNGWLYGKLEDTSMSGWFPEAYVKPLEESTPRGFPLRSSRSVDNLLDQSTASAPDNYWQKSSRPQSSLSSPSSVGEGTLSNSISNAATPSMGSKKPATQDHPPELFPRGTNPFATVKLRPTVTNDRSAPIVRRK
ncbi:PREDICTED: brain-specific angiogenesis inhibitor 1-associated protein 2-like protein 2 isoform X1 [Thamnophis sirtalis]|uniref:Brain-specific angiogenesis inhibitor 1-associated protein 2-like protein 2 isoform X1 n=1 Tax=Thamnophis sirtalis TaxID=35019 RepID=A0A6I9Y106_9SAUR|nr:PREDICTED: brain-specific angiogenesis inhibitor 1-associated protein 2-like protein 2 isoform X1 [Thamnophis sirtalis]